MKYQNPKIMNRWNLIMNNPENENASIFVWGHFGKKLQKLDSERYFAISQNSPHEFLSRIYNRNMEKIIDKMDLDSLFDDIENENYLDNLFRQVSAFLRGNSDMVSIGSALTGQLEKSIKTGKIITKYDNEIEDLK